MLSKSTTKPATKFKPELLAPAGGPESLGAALHFGADAVYLAGKSFSLRYRAENFTLEELAQAGEYVHACGKHLYVTVNALMHPSDLPALRVYLTELAKARVDALIVSDLGALRLAREVAPELSVHISTQASVANAKAAWAYYEMGASRVIAARELSLVELAALREEMPPEMELEVFVHGALCMAVSGRCLMSSFLADRDANRGHCAQPCRWNYRLVEEKRPGEYLPLEEDERGTSILSSCDLNMLSSLDRLKAAGISSFKIEGRMKGAYYVATVVNAYRQVLDGAEPSAFASELEAVSHRSYSTGFYFGEAKQTYEAQDYEQSHDWVATVTDYDLATKTASILQRNPFAVADKLEILSPHHTVRTLIVANLKDQSGLPIAIASKNLKTYTFTTEQPLSPGDLLRKLRN